MNRSTIFLIVLLAVLGVVAYFLIPSEKEREASYKPADIKLVVDSAAVIKIEIQKTGKSVTLENIGGKWMLTSPVNVSADEGVVKQVISSLKKFKVGSLISSNIEKQSVFQVDTSGTKLTMTDRNGASTSLIIGKMGPSYSEVYFRLPGSQDVYLGEGIESWTFNKEVKDWRDKVILSSPSELVKELTYTDGGKEYRFEKDSTGWKSNDKSIDGNAMNTLLNSLANLRADDFLDTEMKSAGRAVKLNIRGNEDIDLSLSPMPPDSSKYVVQTSKSSQVYVVSKWTAQQILKPIVQPGALKKSVAAVSTPAKKEEEAPSPAKVVPAKNTQPTPSVTQKEEKKKTTESSSGSKKGGQSKASLVQPEVKKEPAGKESGTQSSQVSQQTKEVNTPAAKTQPAPPVTTPASRTQQTTKASSPTTDDEGDLTVHTVARGETMPIIAKKYNVTVEQILKWNLLKTITVKPGQELYIFQKTAAPK